MPPTGDHRYFTSTAVFLNEIIKLAVSLSLAIYDTSKTLAPTTPATVLFEQIYNSVFAGDGWKLAITAAFYTLQNMLQYVAVGNLDAVHFQVLYQLKVCLTVTWHPTQGHAYQCVLTYYQDPHYCYIQCCPVATKSGT